MKPFCVGVSDFDTMPVKLGCISPVHNRVAGELCAIVAHHHFGCAALGDQLIEFTCHPVPRQGCVRHERQAFPSAIIKHRIHYVKARVKVYEYPCGRMAIFHGPRQLATFAPDGKAELEPTKAAA